MSNSTDLNPVSLSQLKLPSELSGRISLLRECEKVHTRRKAIFFAAFIGSLFAFQLLIQFAFHLGWLWSGVAGLLPALLLTYKLKPVSVQVPSDDLTMWGRRLIALHSGIPEKYSPAIDQTIAAARNPDPVFKTIVPELLTSIQFDAIYRALAVLIKKDMVIASNCLKHPDRTIRKRVLEILEYEREIPIKDPETLQELMQMMGDPEIGRYAGRLLGRIRPARTELIPRLIEWIPKSDSTPNNLRWATADALGSMGPEAKFALPVLMRAWNEETDPDSKVILGRTIRSIEKKYPEQEEQPRVAYSLVLVIAEEIYFPAMEQLEHKLLTDIRKKPRYPLAEDCSVTALHVPELPEETREAIQGVVWTMQQRYGKRSGRWQSEFQPTTLGVTFLILYLE